MDPTRIMQLTTPHAMQVPHDWLVGFMIIAGTIYYIAFIFFSWTVYTALKKVPEHQRSFPAWFAWMMLIPIVGYVFHWLLLPFGVPNTFKKHLPDNAEATKRATTLFGVGLAYVIIPLLMWLVVANIGLLIANIVLWIIYWVILINFKKRFLNGEPHHTTHGRK